MKINPQSLLTFVAAILLFLQCTTTAGLAQETAETPPALDFTMKNIEGEDVELSKYVGKVVVLVNVASKCGLTPQYEDLQKLHEEYAEKGVAIVGVPCNQFKGQEPGTDEEILQFCQTEYGVEFDMMSKVNVNEPEQCDLYKHLNALDVGPKGKGDVKWNFEKYIIDRTGTPVARFEPKVKVDSKKFLAALDKAVGESSEGDATGHYSHKSEKLGKSYYLFSKSVPLKNSDKVQTIYFFAKDANNKKGTPLSEVPEGKIVAETKTGMLVLKNKDGKKKKYF